MGESDKLYFKNSVEVREKDGRKQLYLLLWVSSHLLKVYNTENKMCSIRYFCFSWQKFWSHQ
jgi:hypothetical protein